MSVYHFKHNGKIFPTGRLCDWVCRRSYWHRGVPAANQTCSRESCDQLLHAHPHQGNISHTVLKRLLFQTHCQTFRFLTSIFGFRIGWLTLAQKEIHLGSWITAAAPTVKPRSGRSMETFALDSSPCVILKLVSSQENITQMFYTCCVIYLHTWILSLMFLQALSWHLITTCTVWATGERHATVDQITALGSSGCSRRWGHYCYFLSQTLYPVFSSFVWHYVSFPLLFFSSRVLWWWKKRRRPGTLNWSPRSGSCDQRANMHMNTSVSAVEREESWWCVIGRTVRKRTTCCVSTSPSHHMVMMRLSFSACETLSGSY